jgi:hypothetical protein
MGTVWASRVAAKGTCYLFRARLNRGEADHFFLDDSFDHETVEQKAIVSRVTTIESMAKQAFAVPQVNGDSRLRGERPSSSAR